METPFILFIISLIIVLALISRHLDNSLSIKKLKSENDSLRSKNHYLEEEIKRLQSDLENLRHPKTEKSPSAPSVSSVRHVSHHASRSSSSRCLTSFKSQKSLVSNWVLISSVTESRACDTDNVNWPIPLPQKEVYRFISRETAECYRTTLANCSCPAYTFNETRPCKHMIRLAICLGYYTHAIYPENQKAFEHCASEYEAYLLGK